MTEIAGALAVKALESTVTGAAKVAGQRLWTSINPFSRKSSKKAKALYQLIGSLDFTSRLSLLDVIDHLPEGVSLRTLEETLTSLPIRTVTHELVSASLAGASPDRHEIIRKNFSLVMQQQLGHAPADQTVLLGEMVFDLVFEASEKIVTEYRDVDPAGFDQLRTAASSGLIESTLRAVGRHHTALNQFSDLENLQMLENWVTEYRQQASVAHGYIAPPDFERKRKVPMESLYVPPRIRELGISEPESDGEVHAFASKIDRTVLLGDPGGGKSTAANYIAYMGAKDVKSRIPFIVVLRDFARKDDLDRSVISYIEDRCDSYYQCKPPPGAIEHLLLNGQALVIFDGLDELIDTTLRREVTQRVELFSERFPLAAALVTSRRVGYEQAQLDTNVFRPFLLGGFEDEDVELYVRKWFSSVEELEGDELDDACASFIEESQSVPDLTSTPLMLALMCIIYRGQGYIPRNRPAVYESCALLLFEKWDSSRKIFVGLRAADQVDTAIKHLAYWMLTHEAGAEAVTESELVREASHFLSTTFEDQAERLRAAEEFVEFCRGRAWVLSDAGTTADGEALFKFTHRTFMEYFAAYELTRRADGPKEIAKELLPRVAKQEWDVVGQLAVQISNKHSRNGGERIVTVLLDDKRRRKDEKRDNILTFIWRCLTFMNVSPATLRRLTKESLESSFTLRKRASYSGGGYTPSILNSVKLVAEQRAVVAEVLATGLGEMLRSNEEERQRYAKVAMLTWDAMTGHLAMKAPAMVWWSEWTERLSRLHIKEILAAGPGEQDAWIISLIRGRVDMDDFLSQATSWDVEFLDPLFVLPAASPLGFHYAPWAMGCLRPSYWVEPTTEGLVKRRETMMAQLKSLGARLPCPATTPWLGPLAMGSTPFRFWFAEEDWRPFTDDEDINWAMWAIFSTALEIEESETRRTPSSDDVPQRFSRRITEVRAGVQVLSTTTFDGTMFADFHGERREWRDAWARHEISYRRRVD